MGRVEGKVALITGAARGQGRSHAVTLAAEGADIIAVDICSDVETLKYPGSSESDLAETVKMVEALDRRVLSRQADVRDLDAINRVVADGIAEFGKIDVVCANAGILTFGAAWELTEEEWQTTIDVNLTGVWKSVRAVIPHMIERGEGSLILTSSTAGVAAYGNTSNYVASKHGVTGLSRALAIELAQKGVRCNSVHPTQVATPMIQNQYVFDTYLGREGVTFEEAELGFQLSQAIPIPWLDPIDVSNAVLYLASDESRYVTGHALQVDAGATSPFRFPNG